MKKVIIVGAFALVSGLASAQTVQPSGFYIGGDIGSATVDLGNIKSELQSAIQSVGATNTSVGTDDTHNSYKIFGGYKINKYFSVEGGYVNFGKFTANASAQISGLPLSASGEVKSHALFADAVGFLNANEEFSVFGKIGFAYAKTEAKASASYNGASASANDSASTFSPKLGIGIQYYVTRNIALRAEYEDYFSVGDKNKTGQSDIKIGSVGITFGF